MNEDQYNQRKSEFNNQIDELHQELKTKRVNLENDYHEKRASLNKQIDQASQQLDIFRSRTREALGSLDQFSHEQQDDEFFDKADYAYGIGELEESNQRQIEEFQTTIENLKQAVTDETDQYHQQDEQLQTDTFAEIHQIEAKIDDLDDDFNNQDQDGW